MSTHKHFDKICCVALVLTLLLTGLFMCGESLGIQKTAAVMGYENRLFNTSSVHTIDIVMDDWDGFIETCATEEYASCTVIIDGEAYKNVAIRAKGNTSLTQVQSYGNDRYSFKIEFDHYDSTKTYYGLDKLCLNNIIQDNTYMKDYLTYQLMGQFGVASPLCSYTNITVNGETWGLYLAVEGVEKTFLQRNYGSNYGKLYKPDSMNMGGGRGNGQGFHMDDWNGLNSNADNAKSDSSAGFNNGNGLISDIFPNQNGGGMMFPPQFDIEQIKTMLNAMDDAALLRIAQALEYADVSELLSALDSAESLEDFLNGKNFTALALLFAGQGGFARPGMNNNGGGMQMPGNMGGHSMGSNDVLLIYTDDEYDSYSNIFDSAKTDITDADKDRLIAALKNINENTALESSVDIESVIRYFVVHNFVLNFDSYTGSMTHNYYLYEKDGALSMIPWDYNLAFGGFQSAGSATSLVNYPIDSPVSGGTVDSRPMLAWIFSNTEYTEQYHGLFTRFISEFFDSGKFSDMISSVKEMISPYVEEDPTKFCTYEEFIAGIDTLKEFCLLRAESITGQLNGTIGSTSETQSQNTLVSADDITISAMGSMNTFMGGGMNMPGGNMGGNQNQPNGAAGSNMPGFNADGPAADGTLPEAAGNHNSASNGMTPAQPNGNHAVGGTSPKFPNGEMPSDSNNRGGPLPGGMKLPDSTRFGNISDQPFGQAGQNAYSIASWIWLGISVILLVLGLLFAFLFKKRG